MANERHSACDGNISNRKCMMFGVLLCVYVQMDNQPKVICGYLSDFDLWTNRISAVNKTYEISTYRTHGHIVEEFYENVHLFLKMSFHQFIEFDLSIIVISGSSGWWFHIWKCHKQTNQSEIYGTVSWIQFKRFNSFVSWLVAHKSSGKSVREKERKREREMNAEESINCNSISRNERIGSKGYLLAWRWKFHPFSISLINDCYSFI